MKYFNKSLLKQWIDKSRYLNKSPFLLERIFSAPAYFYLYLRHGTDKNSSRLVRCRQGIYYLEIAKCASSTIIETIWAEYKSNFYKKSIGLSRNCKNKRRITNNSFIFTFVRNPYRRVLSVYLDKIKKEADEQEVYNFNGPLRNISGKSLSFKEFVEIITKIPDNITDIHLRSYSDLIKKNNLRIDFIGRLERFSEDWNLINKLLCLPSAEKINSKNKNTRKHNLDDYYTPELKEKVYRRYENDFKAFGYKK